ncbi:MAG: hypothetical protein QOG53_2055 [Frankiales bacterium]|jgi:hypothetical protein|nr:hypothetical protein [Frankiales bacterium]
MERSESSATDTTRVIRPAAILNDAHARAVLTELEANDVGAGGVWNASIGLWQRYDHAWNGPGGGIGTARLVGTIATVYGSPTKYEITIYRATVSAFGLDSGWTVESLCDDALKAAGLTLASCPRAEMMAAPEMDPFRLGETSEQAV